MWFFSFYMLCYLSKSVVLYALLKLLPFISPWQASWGLYQNFNVHTKKLSIVANCLWFCLLCCMFIKAKRLHTNLAFKPLNQCICTAVFSTSFSVHFIWENLFYSQFNLGDCFSFFSWSFWLIKQWYIKEKLDACHCQGLNG